MAKVGTGARFAALKSKLSGQKGVTDPAALAASIGRKKYGAKRMAAWASRSRKKITRESAVGKMTESQLREAIVEIKEKWSAAARAAAAAGRKSRSKGGNWRAAAAGAYARAGGNSSLKKGRFQDGVSSQQKLGKMMRQSGKDWNKGKRINTGDGEGATKYSFAGGVKATLHDSGRTVFSKKTGISSKSRARASKYASSTIGRLENANTYGAGGKAERIENRAHAAYRAATGPKTSRAKMARALRILRRVNKRANRWESE